MICSITLTSETKEALIGDALKSVINWVDIALIIHLQDPNIIPDKTLEIAKSIAKDKLRIVSIDLAGKTTADLRNIGLDEATKLGCEWCVQLDTDERILTNNVNIPKSLQDVPKHVPAVVVSEDTGNYDKPRFFRLPTNGRFQALCGTHEDFNLECSFIMPKVRFHELPRSPESWQIRLKNDLNGLNIQVENEPSNPRWIYYKGATLESLGELESAIEAYKISATLWTDNGMVAWTHFRIGCCFYKLKQPKEVLKYCVEGMLFKPDYAELPWLLGVTNQAMNKHHEAIAWCKIALVNTWSGKKENQIKRIGFREPVAYFESPYQVMSISYDKLGMNAQKQWADREAAKAKKNREDLVKKGIS